MLNGSGVGWGGGIPGQQEDHLHPYKCNILGFLVIHIDDYGSDQPRWAALHARHTKQTLSI